MASMRIGHFRRPRRLRDDDVIIEFIDMGRFIRVSAIDQATGIEVSMVGDPKAGKDTLSRLAARKLRYVLRNHALKKPKKHNRKKRVL